MRSLREAYARTMRLSSSLSGIQKIPEVHLDFKDIPDFVFSRRYVFISYHPRDMWLALSNIIPEIRRYATRVRLSFELGGSDYYHYENPGRRSYAEVAAASKQRTSIDVSISDADTTWAELLHRGLHDQLIARDFFDVDGITEGLQEWTRVLRAHGIVADLSKQSWTVATQGVKHCRTEPEQQGQAIRQTPAGTETGERKRSTTIATYSGGRDGGSTKTSKDTYEGAEGGDEYVTRRTASERSPHAYAGVAASDTSLIALLSSELPRFVFAIVLVLFE